MASIPITERALLIRTNFDNESAWQSVTSSVSRPSQEMLGAIDILKMANAHLDDSEDLDLSSLSVEMLNDAQYRGMNTEQLLDCLPADYPHAYLFVFDEHSAYDSEQSLLVVDLFHQRGRTFRTIPEEIQSIDSNLSIANMDWEDFSSTCDDQGVFRGFPYA